MPENGILLADMENGLDFLLSTYYKKKAVYGEQILTFRCTCVRKSGGGGILARMDDVDLPSDDELDNFTSPVMQTDMLIIERSGKDMAVVWEKVNVRRVLTDSGLFWSITSARPGSRKNRRADERVPVGVRTDITVRGKKMSAQIHDISRYDFMVELPEHAAEIGDPVAVAFKDLGVKITAEGVCVRKQKTNGSTVLFGCMSGREIRKVRNYQKKKMQGMGGKSETSSIRGGSGCGCHTCGRGHADNYWDNNQRKCTEERPV